jgi:hypothetical protein
LKGTAFPSIACRSACRAFRRSSRSLPTRMNHSRPAARRRVPSSRLPAKSPHWTAGRRRGLLSVFPGHPPSWPPHGEPGWRCRAARPTAESAAPAARPHTAAARSGRRPALRAPPGGGTPTHLGAIACFSNSAQSTPNVLSACAERPASAYEHVNMGGRGAWQRARAIARHGHAHEAFTACSRGRSSRPAAN